MNCNYHVRSVRELPNRVINSDLCSDPFNMQCRVFSCKTIGYQYIQKQQARLCLLLFFSRKTKNQYWKTRNQPTSALIQKSQSTGDQIVRQMQ